jgi:hypothetical protein
MHEDKCARSAPIAVFKQMSFLGSKENASLMLRRLVKLQYKDEHGCCG